MQHTPTRVAAPPKLGPAAAWYARALGWPVFPLLPGDKLPLIGNPHPKDSQERRTCRGECGQAGHGFHDATTDPDRIGEWWRRWPTANIGVRCGVTVDVLDVDGPDGRASLAVLAMERGLDPAGWVASSSGRLDGGTHYWFITTGLDRARGFRPHLDYLGDGGYVIAPPSIHPSGRVYAWQSGPPRGLLPAVPDELVEALVEHAHDRQPIGQHLIDYTPGAGGDGARPGDDYNRRANWLELLGPLGWTVARQIGDEVRLSRPGKVGGISATVNHYGNNELHVFSSDPAASPFEADRCYRPFQGYALIHHGGDWSAAAKALRERGYGAVEKDERPTTRRRRPRVAASSTSTARERWTR